jgi:hypothetical protein
MAYKQPSERTEWCPAGFGQDCDPARSRDKILSYLLFLIEAPRRIRRSQRPDRCQANPLMRTKRDEHNFVRIQIQQSPFKESADPRSSRFAAS